MKMHIGILDGRRKSGGNEGNGGLRPRSARGFGARAGIGDPAVKIEAAKYYLKSSDSSEDSLEKHGSGAQSLTWSLNEDVGLIRPRSFD